MAQVGETNFLQALVVALVDTKKPMEQVYQRVHIPLSLAPVAMGWRAREAKMAIIHPLDQYLHQPEVVAVGALARIVQVPQVVLVAVRQTAGQVVREPLVKGIMVVAARMVDNRRVVEVAQEVSVEVPPVRTRQQVVLVCHRLLVVQLFLVVAAVEVAPMETLALVQRQMAVELVALTVLSETLVRLIPVAVAVVRAEMLPVEQVVLVL